jgi:uncharacterized protein YigE (DUF2233 family)
MLVDSRRRNRATTDGGGLPHPPTGTISRTLKEPKLHMESIIFTLGRSFFRTATILFAVLVSLGLPSSRAAAQPDSNLCRSVQYADSTFVVCTVDLRKYEVRLFWRGPDGEVLGSFDRLRGTPEGSRLAVAMNAGMYHEDRSPVGLYVENGKELKTANTRRGCHIN